MEANEKQDEARAFIRREIEEVLAKKGEAFEKNIIRQLNDILIREQEANGNWAEKVRKDLMNNLKSALPSMQSQIVVGAINSLVFAVIFALTSHFLK